MATLTAFRGFNPGEGFQMDTGLSFYEVEYGNLVSFSSTTIVLRSPYGTTQTYSGRFTYDYYGNVYGTLTGFSESIPGKSAIWKISGCNMSVSTYLYYANTGNGEGLKEALLVGNDTVIGSSYDDVLLSYAGNDKLDGGLGADKMSGGIGDDTYYVDNISDVVTEEINAGLDTVNVGGGLVTAGGTYILTDNIEKAALTGTGNASIDASGSTIDVVLSGNSGKNTLTGGSGNDTLDGGAGADMLAGGLGNDLYIVDNVLDVITELADGGTDTVQVKLTSGSYTLGNNLENATILGTGSVNLVGNDTDNVLTGNAGTNKLYGGAGNDVLSGGAGADLLDGGAGSDTMDGGTGNDTYVVDALTDVVIESLAGATGGTDTVQSAVSYELGANLENLTLTGTGDIDGTGNALNNVLIGNSGHNILDGGLGADKLAGGLGDDTYYVDNILDVVTEGVNAGTDTVHVNLNNATTYRLGANLENVILGGSQNLKVIGNVLNNELTGNSGNNILDGGLGADKMSGEIGDDTYYVDNISDVVTEEINAGLDMVNVGGGLVTAGGTYILTDNIEKAALTGTGNASIDASDSTIDVVLSGNSGKNTLTGGSGNDTLDGGAGADMLAGGLGNDLYIVDNVLDVITELADGGTDTVQVKLTSGSYTLGNNLENATILGTGSVNLVGNDTDNVLIGNNSNNILSGGDGNDTLFGNAGNDTLSGGEGDDILNGGLGKDVIYGGAGDDIISYDALDIVDGGDGRDTLDASVQLGAVTINLSDGASQFKQIENIIGGNGADTLIGDGNDNCLTGGAGADLLSGGLGVDRLYGGSGNDTLDGGVGADMIDGGEGDDIIIFDAADEATSVNGGSGSDWLTAAGALNGVNINLADYIGIENIIGSDFDDILVGSSENNVLIGGSGNDVLSGGSGIDEINGGDGNDSIIYDAEDLAKNVYGGTGIDSLVAELAESGVTINLSDYHEIEDLVGSNFNDSLKGDSGANFIDGGRGNDFLWGAAGNDILSGGEGEDVYGFGFGDGNDVILKSASLENIMDRVLFGTGVTKDMISIGRSGNDLVLTLYAGQGSLRLENWFENDSDHINQFEFSDGSIYEIYNSTWVVPIEGTNEGDTVYGSGFSDKISGLDGNDSIYGLSGNDYLDGGNGNDFLYGGDGVDTLIGGNGDDILESGEGNGERMYGGAGNDILKSTAHNYFSGFYVDGGDGQDTITGSFINANIYGGNGDDVIHQDYGLSYIDGGDGNDTIEAYYGDTLVGGTGNDTYSIYRDDAANLKINNYSVSGGNEIDILKFDPEEFTIDAFAFNREGNDLVLSLLEKGSETVRVLDWFISADYQIDQIIFGDNTILSSEDITALTTAISSTTEEADKLVGTGKSDNIAGLGGNDKLYGLSGNDNLDGGDGDDFLYGGDGADILIGGNGDDILESGEGNGEQMYGGPGNDILKSTAHNYFSGFYVDGGDGQDTITGSFINANIYGGNGDDVIHQDYGLSYIDGGDGNDTIEAYSGDRLVGGMGNDTYSIYRSDAANLKINNYSTQADNEIDVLKFGTGNFTASAFAFRHDGNDLVLSLLSNGSETVRIENWFISSDYQIDAVVFGDNQIYNASQITALVK